jgi:DNA-binding response OmpR family regulator
MATPPTPSVLLVSQIEDERDIYGDALREAGFTVHTGDDLQHAVDEASATRAQVIIIRMVPWASQDGIDLVRRIKTNAYDPGVIIITAQVEPDLRAKAVGAGCDVYLLLPCLPDQLTAEVRRVLASRSPIGGTSPSAHVPTAAARVCNTQPTC